MDEESLRPGHWLGLVLFVPLSALRLKVGWQKGHPAHKKTHSTNFQKFSSEIDGGEGHKGNWMTQVHPGKWLLNGSSSMSSSCIAQLIFQLINS